MMSRESVQPSIQPSRSQSSSSPSERPKGRIRHERTHHLTSVRPSFLGQMNSIRLPSSDPSPSAKSGICSRIFDRIVRWTELLMKGISHQLEVEEMEVRRVSSLLEHGERVARSLSREARNLGEARRHRDVFRRYHIWV
jgi:hypothetical protein